MGFRLNLEDNQYRFTYIDHVRLIARAVVFDEEGKVALTKLLADDMFGHRDYYELPGGGVNPDETLEEAAMREIREEVGYESQVVGYIGEVDDFYNLIHRENHNHYFLLKAKNFVGTKMEEGERHLIEKVIWVEPEVAIRLFEQMDDTMLSGLVKHRELPIIRLAVPLIKKQGR